jgi:mobilization protein
VGQISSLNFKKSIAVNIEHNNRSMPPTYLLVKGGKGFQSRYVSFNGSKSAVETRDKYIEACQQAYLREKGKKFQAKSYLWSAVINLKESSTIDDVSKVRKYLEKETGFKCYQLALHADEGYVDDDGVIQINYHAHLEFVTLDLATGINLQRKLSPAKLRELQTGVAAVLQMERGEDKRISGRQRIEPRQYARAAKLLKEKAAPAVKELEEQKVTQALIKDYFSGLRRWLINSGLGLQTDYVFLNQKKLDVLNQHKIEPLSLSELKGLVSGITAQLTDKISTLEADKKQLEEKVSSWQADYLKLERDFEAVTAGYEKQLSARVQGANPAID